jgi:hypothetical protein
MNEGRNRLGDPLPSLAKSFQPRALDRRGLGWTNCSSPAKRVWPVFFSSRAAVVYGVIDGHAGVVHEYPPCYAPPRCPPPLVSSPLLSRRPTLPRSRRSERCQTGCLRNPLPTSPPVSASPCREQAITSTTPAYQTPVVERAKPFFLACPEFRWSMKTPTLLAGMGSAKKYPWAELQPASANS